MVNYWCTRPLFNYSRHFKNGAVCFPLRVGICGSSGFYMAFSTFPRIKLPAHCLFLRTQSRDCHFMKTKLAESKLPEGQEWMQTQTSTHPKHIPYKMPLTCLCRPTGNLRVLILDVKRKINVNLNKLCHLRGNSCRVSKGQFSVW